MFDDPLVQANLTTLTIHLVFGLIALFVSAIAIWAIDLVLLKKINLEEEIGRGNLAAAVYAGAIWIALATIVTQIG